MLFMLVINYKFNVDMFWLLASERMGLETIEETKIHIENLYQRLFIKHEQPKIDDSWFDLLNIYMRHKEILCL